MGKIKKEKRDKPEEDEEEIAVPAKKAKKEKKIKEESADGDVSMALDTTTGSVKQEDDYDEKVSNVSVIAKPLASKKLTKKCYKLIKKAIKQKSFLRNGLKDVQRRIRKGETGLVLFAGDVTPIDIICHLPAVCEEKGIPYVYTPSRIDLGAAMGVKRGTVTLLVREHPEYKDLYDELKNEISMLPIPA